MSKKKKKHARKKQIQQRKASKAQKRQKRRKKTSPARSTVKSGPDTELLDDMLALFPQANAAIAPPEESMLPLMEAVFDSEELIEEPEFDDLVLPPLECIQIFIQEAAKHDITPEMIPDLSEEDREETYLDTLEEVSKIMVNDEFRREMVERLDMLRIRWKRKWFGKKKKIAQAAAVQAFLQGDDEDSREIWPVMGLTLALVDRSVQAGFALSAAAMEAADAEDLENEEDILALAEKISRSPAGKELANILDNTPGLNRFFEEQADETWEKGSDAVFMGELYLELFDADEIEEALATFKETVLEDVSLENLSEEDSPVENLVEDLFEEHGETFIAELKAYIDELFTPERLNRYRERLEEVLRDPELADWQQYLYMLRQDANRDPEEAKQFLLTALLGETRIAITAGEIYETEAEDDEDAQQGE